MFKSNNAIIPINVYGDTILRKKTHLVTDIDKDTIQLIKNMFDTMRNANGVGLAANQVGVDKSIFTIDISCVEKYEKIKPVVMINPKIVSYSDEIISLEEGCLSIPYLRADVERPKLVQIMYFDTDMKENTIEADELFARVIQHEYDHLQGKLFTDRMPEDLRKILKKDLSKIKNRKIDVDYPVTDNF